MFSASPLTLTALCALYCFRRAVARAYLLCRWLTSTRFGKIRAPSAKRWNRVLFSGYATSNFKLFVFVLCAIIAGMGERCMCQAGIINPSEMAPDKSLEAVVWVAVGGRGTVGPIQGRWS